MRAQLVSENVKFERGQNPLDAIDDKIIIEFENGYEIEGPKRWEKEALELVARAETAMEEAFMMNLDYEGTSDREGTEAADEVLLDFEDEFNKLGYKYLFISNSDSFT